MFTLHMGNRPSICVFNMQLATQIRNQSLIDQFYNTWENIDKQFKDKFWNGKWNLTLINYNICITFSEYDLNYADIHFIERF